LAQKVPGTFFGRSADVDQAFDDLVCEVSAKLEAGEGVDLDAIAVEHPEHADRLRKLLPTLEAMAELGHSDSGLFATSAASRGPAEPKTGVLGDYRILREIGRGGMGVVYEAEQVSLRRKVALKVLPFAAMLDQRQLQRFQKEARAAASLRHPNIVQVHFVGCERAVHFYAMDYIEGQTLAELITHLRRLEASGGKIPQDAEKAVSDLADTLTSGRFASPNACSAPNVPTAADMHEQTPGGTAETKRTPHAAISTERSTKSAAYFRSIAEIGVQVAEALDHAHEHGVVHRDVKPANVILDNGGKPWVTDFGLARIDSPSPAAGEGRGEGLTLTVTGDLLGTVRYMSPEQALAKRIVVDHRTDVYSLGATLYELLTLQPVFSGQDRQELLRQIAFEEPKSPRKLNKAIPEELEIIVTKAMAKNPAERYDTAQELADDLRRFLEYRPILARRLSFPFRLSRWCKRNPIAAALIALLVFLAVAGPAVAVNQSYLASAHMKASERADEEARRARQAATRERRIRRQTYRHLYNADMNSVQHAWDEASTERAIELLRRHLPTSEREDLRGFEWYHFWQKCHPQVRTLDHESEVLAVAFSPDGQTVATGSHDHTVKLWQSSTGNVKTTLKGHLGSVRSVAFSPDGALLASGSDDHSVKVWDVNTGELVASLNAHEERVSSVVFSPNGKTLASGSRDRTVKLWQLPGFREQLAITGSGRIDAMTFSPDGQLLASAGLRHGVQVHDIETGELRWKPESVGCFYSVTFSPNGEILARGGPGLKLWNCKTRELMATYLGPEVQVNAIAFSADGKKLAAGGYDRRLRLWTVQDGELLATYQGHSDWITSVAFCPDGSTAASTSCDGTTKLWRVDEGLPRNCLRSHLRRLDCVAFSPDGKLAASAGEDGAVKLWQGTTGELQQILEQGKHVGAVTFSPDGTLLASASYRDDLIKLWSVDDGKLVVTLEGRQSTPKAGWSSSCYRSVAFSPDGMTLASAGLNESVQLWDISSQKELSSLTGHSGFVQSVAFSPTGGTLASGGTDMTVRLWDARSGRLLQTLTGHSRLVSAVVFSPDGRTLASASQDHTVKLWDVNAGTLRDTLKGHVDHVCTVAFSPDGKTLATGSVDKTIKLWDVPTAELKTTLRGHTYFVRSVAFFADGRILASASWDQTVRLWRADRPSEGQLPFEKAEQVLIDPLGRVANCFREGDWESAATHLSRAIELQPDNGDVLRQRRLAYVHLKEWDKAAEDQNQIVKLQPEVPIEALIRAQLLLLADCKDEYDKACAEVLDQFGESEKPGHLFVTARACSLGPSAACNPSVSVALAQHALAKSPAPWTHYFLGLAQLRAGQFEEAESNFHKSLSLGANWYERQLNWFGLAMVHHASGETGEARQLFDKAAARMDANPEECQLVLQDWLDALLLRREVEQLLAQSEQEKDDAEREQEAPVAKAKPEDAKAAESEPPAFEATSNAKPKEKQE
jgi:WD40 repeat protein/serine/threonine protein kinase